MNSDIILAVVVLGGLWGFFFLIAYGSDMPDDYLPYRDLMDDPDVPEHVKEEFRK